MSLGHKTNCFKTWHRRQFFLSSKINVSFYPNQSIAVLTILVFGSFTFIKSQCRILYDFDALLFLLRYNLNDKSVTGHVWLYILVLNVEMAWKQSSYIFSNKFCYKSRFIFKLILKNYLCQTKLCSSICKYFDVLYNIVHSIRELWGNADDLT